MRHSFTAVVPTSSAVRRDGQALRNLRDVRVRGWGREGGWQGHTLWKRPSLRIAPLPPTPNPAFLNVSGLVLHHRFPPHHISLSLSFPSPPPAFCFSPRSLRPFVVLLAQNVFFFFFFLLSSVADAFFFFPHKSRDALWKRFVLKQTSFTMTISYVESRFFLTFHILLFRSYFLSAI